LTHINAVMHPKIIEDQDITGAIDGAWNA